MTSCEEIIEIIKNSEKENLKVEFKESKILRNPGGKRDLAYEIIAFANREGGQLILGIKDDCTFEGKGIFNVDKDKGIIDNIIHNNISPVINYNIEIFPCIKGDVLIVNIFKRKDIPHAYIGSREGPEIKSRIYYIRTPHGRRLLTDKQLQYLFNEKEINFVYSFRIVINYLKNSLKIALLNMENPICVQKNYMPLLHNLPEDDIKRITKGTNDLHSFFIEITPYMLLNSFSWLFQQSWLIMINKYDNQIESIPISTEVPKKKISIEDLPKPPKNSMISSLSLDFKKLMEYVVFPNFYVPLNTELQILNENKGRTSQLILKHDDFNFDLKIGPSTGGGGLEFLHPRKTAYENRYVFDIQENFNYLFQFIQMKCKFLAKFNFPEKNSELFDNYYQYGKTIRDILENQWDYDKFIKKLPHHMLYSIDFKLNDIMQLLKEKK